MTSLAELDHQVKNFRQRNELDKIWFLLERKPFNQDSISKLVKDGWVVTDSGYPTLSICDEKKKEIQLANEISGGVRDVHLFHELVHAWYGDELNDGGYFSFISYKANKNRVIVDWLAFQLRADPEILRHTILSFGLTPQIYDRASFEAFSDYKIDFDKQLVATTIFEISE